MHSYDTSQNSSAGKESLRACCTLGNTSFLAGSILIPAEISFQNGIILLPCCGTPSRERKA